MPVPIIVLLDMAKVNDHERFATIFIWIATNTRLYDQNIGYENFEVNNGAIRLYNLPDLGSVVQWFIILASR